MNHVRCPWAAFVVVGQISAACCFVSPTLAVDFQTEIQPIIESACLSCHNPQNAEGELRLDSLQNALTGGDRGAAIVPGKPEESPFYATTVLPADDDGIMPPEGPPLAKSQTERLRKWIAEGAKWTASAKLQVQPRIDFVKHIQPILEVHCLSCHSGDEPEADYSLATRKAAMESGVGAPSIVAFSPNESALYALTILHEEADELMPPGDPLPQELTERLRLWISQGAIWPDGVTLKQRARVDRGTTTPDSMDLVRRIHNLIAAQSADQHADKMANYTGQVPKTGVSYEMVAIKGGEFLMGSPDSEAHRSVVEGPQTKVRIDSFWMGKHEVTWDEYEPFMITQVDRAKNGTRIDYDPNVHSVVDAVSQPTPPYMEMSFGMGQYGYPAISMTQHAASKYCQWLSAQTGHFYRLPTEAEWEYACRAGSVTAYSFGDDSSRLGEYAWYYDNSNEKYQKVGQKKPNAWGLHDMHGNVMEWTADQFVPDYFTQIGRGATNPFVRPERLYPRSVRGGGWDDDPEQLRSAARRGSEASWKQQDPQLPKSVWYHTDARWLGFRIIRPRSIPPPEEMHYYWNSATNKR